MYVNLWMAQPCILLSAILSESFRNLRDAMSVSICPRLSAYARRRDGLRVRISLQADGDASGFSVKLSLSFASMLHIYFVHLHIHI